MLAIAAGLLEWSSGVAKPHAVLLGGGRGHEHSGAVLKSAGYAWHPGIIGEARVAVAGGQGRV